MVLGFSAFFLGLAVHRKLRVQKTGYTVACRRKVLRRPFLTADFHDMGTTGVEIAVLRRVYQAGNIAGDWLQPALAGQNIRQAFQ